MKSKFFGRAGEEIAALRQAGVPYEIIPGVTSALGAAAVSEIPLTLRGVSSAVVFVTAHQNTTHSRHGSQRAAAVKAIQFMQDRALLLDIRPIVPMHTIRCVNQ